jgi:hypothetical protein
MLNLTEESKGTVDEDLRDQISRIEDDIEELTKTLDGCRKTMLLSKVIIATGGIGIVAYLLGAIWVGPAVIIGAIAAVVGGVVIFGSNSTTSNNAMSALAGAERRRNQLIEKLNLRAIHSDVGG